MPIDTRKSILTWFRITGFILVELADVQMIIEPLFGAVLGQRKQD